ncbi:MAG: hypothetical protein C4518_16910 [Desulfobacteraceae bacterium]|nr:MAG: hypothetical protein C4518_16910 [Desulfobacteraceae bacterium]
MKKALKWTLPAIAMCFMIWGQAMAANGSCIASQNKAQEANEFAPKPAERPCELFINGTPTTISGTVYEATYAGQGLTVDTGTEMITVYGFGPDRFWENLGVSKPEVGENVVIEAVILTFSDGSERIIATSITIDGDAISLRDENGKPLWRRAGQRMNQGGQTE